MTSDEFPLPELSSAAVEGPLPETATATHEASESHNLEHPEGAPSEEVAIPVDAQDAETPQNPQTELKLTESPAPAVSPDPATASLPELAALSQTGRLSPTTETRAAELLRQALLGGRAEISEALDAIAILPWPVSVNALNAAWPGMKPYGRRLFVSGMKNEKFADEAGRRIRISLTRGLAKVDETQAAKWACALAAEILQPDGTLAARDRQSFFNVFVGKGKPWLLRLPLTGLKDADVRPFLSCAVATIFSGGCPPFSQQSLLQWILTSGKSDLLDEKPTAVIAQAIRKWPGRLLRDFPQRAAEFPEPIAEALKARALPKAMPAAPVEDPEDLSADRTEDTEEDGEKRASLPGDDEEEEDEDRDDEDDSEETERDEDREEDDEESEDDDEEDEDEEDDEDRDDEKDDAPAQPSPARRHPPYVSPGQVSRQGQPPPQPQQSRSGQFDPVAALRQVDSFLRQQTQQLQAAKSALRQREDEVKRLKRNGGGRGGRRDRYGSENVWPEATQPEDADSLRRLVTQLETTNAELRQRLEDLTSDAEQHAQALTGPDGAPLGERAQLTQFLSLKLARDHADFLRLQAEPDDEVFREHYRLILKSVFEILAAEGIQPPAPSE